MKRIMFVGGGTVGHIAPLLAVMEAVQEAAPKTSCAYVGLAADLEAEAITSSKLTFEKFSIRAGKLHRFLTLDQFRQAKNLVGGLRDGARVVREWKPDSVFAKGGYITLPVVLAAARRGIPIVIHETDVIPGMANRIAAKFAQRVCTSFPVEVMKHIPVERAIQTGQPVRKEFYVRRSELPYGLDAAVPVVTVIGGSQGARRLNTLISAIWQDIAKSFQLVHITGKQNYEVLSGQHAALPAELRQRIILKPFVGDELPALFQKSAVVVSRAGGSIAELAVSRACTLLVPLSTSAQNHQWANARVLEAVDAAHTFDEVTGTPSDLLAKITELATNDTLQTELRASIGQFDFPGAAAAIAECLLHPHSFD